MAFAVSAKIINVLHNPTAAQQQEKAFSPWNDGVLRQHRAELVVFVSPGDCQELCTSEGPPFGGWRIGMEKWEAKPLA